MLTDGRTTDARVTGILIAHLGAFGSGELKNQQKTKMHAKLTSRQRVSKLMKSVLISTSQYRSMYNYGGKI